MLLAMTREVSTRCAVTGSAATRHRSAQVPRSPQQIAESASIAAKAGAAIVHCHARVPDKGAPSRDQRFDRAAYVTECGPDISALGRGTLNFDEADCVTTNPLGFLLAKSGLAKREWV